MSSGLGGALGGLGGGSSGLDINQILGLIKDNPELIKQGQQIYGSIFKGLGKGIGNILDRVIPNKKEDRTTQSNVPSIKNTKCKRCVELRKKKSEGKLSSQEEIEMIKACNEIITLMEQDPDLKNMDFEEFCATNSQM
jgi:hypothetical protein